MNVKTALLYPLVAVLLAARPTLAESITFQDIVDATAPLPEATIFVAKDVITLDPKTTDADAVAVVGDRILAAGTLKELQSMSGKQPMRVDRTFADKVIAPGFIAQHDHPLLGGLSMTSAIISIEDWALPGRTIPAAKNQGEYRQRLREAEDALGDPDELLFSWGFHAAFHGSLTRSDLDKISTVRPIIIWHRSCHEFILNSKALDVIGVDEDVISAMSEGARQQSSYAEGRFWEMGLFGILDRLLPFIATPERLQNGFQFVENYYHVNGVTAGSEPGGIYSRPLQEAANAVFSDPDTPFRFYFLPDGKSIYSAFPGTTILETEKTQSWGRGMTSVPPKMVKLFADGAIFGPYMQLREPPLDDSHGEWMVPPRDFANAFQIYWDADYQIHVHVNGDAGLDMVLDNLEANMRRNPRIDHRTVIVHFAVSQRDQVERISRLGAIVSANPYYVRALADIYGKTALGPGRADNMVRIGDVERAGISYSFHADMPMAPAQPLFLMDVAINRATFSGRVAGRKQRASREGAFKAITLEAAYSLRLEKEIGSIEPGKFANFTILSDNPLTVKATKIKDITIWGTVHEGRIMPVRGSALELSSAQGAFARYRDFSFSPVAAKLLSRPAGTDSHGDICALNRRFAAALATKT